MYVYIKKIRDELKLRNYSPKTIASYLACVTEYLRAILNNSLLSKLYIQNVAGSCLLCKLLLFFD